MLVELRKKLFSCQSTLGVLDKAIQICESSPDAVDALRKALRTRKSLLAYIARLEYAIELLDRPVVDPDKRADGVIEPRVLDRTGGR